MFILFVQQMLYSIFAVFIEFNMACISISRCDILVCVGFALFLHGAFKEVDGMSITIFSDGPAEPPLYEPYYYDPYGDYSEIANDSMPECSIASTCLNITQDLHNWTKPLCQVFATCFPITAFPQAIPRNVTILNIQSGFFRNLTLQNMKNFTKLSKLSLEFNDLRNIEPRAFSEQRQLKVLRIHGNILHEIFRETFQGLSSVENLNLGNNRIQKISDGSFSGLEHAADLNLNFNDIESLNDYVFRGLSSLEHLVLQQNNISYISPFAFKELDKLKTLNLKQNRLTKFPTKSLRVLTSVSTLFVGKNPILSLDRGFLKGLRSLKDLWLEECLIESVAKRAFNDKDIRTLVLEGNRLTSLPNLGRMEQLRVLNLDRNPWRCDRNALSMLTWLHRHDLMDVTVTCASPKNRKNRNLLTFSAEELVQTETKNALKFSTTSSGLSADKNVLFDKKYQSSTPDRLRAFPMHTPTILGLLSSTAEARFTKLIPATLSSYLLYNKASTTSFHRDSVNLEQTNKREINVSSLSRAVGTTTEALRMSDKDATPVKRIGFSVVMVMVITIVIISLAIVYLLTRKIIVKCYHSRDGLAPRRAGRKPFHRNRKELVSIHDPRLGCGLTRQPNGKKRKSELFYRSLANGKDDIAVDRDPTDGNCNDEQLASSSNV